MRKVSNTNLIKNYDNEDGRRGWEDGRMGECVLGQRGLRELNIHLS